MTQTCKICTDSRRDAIEQALADGVTLRTVGEQFDLKKDTLRRHKEHATLPASRAAVETRDIIPAVTWTSYWSADRVKQSEYVLQELQEMGWPAFTFQGQQGGNETACREFVAHWAAVGSLDSWRSIVAMTRNLYEEFLAAPV